MARGKYSPTVEAAYANDQEWFRKYAGEDENGIWQMYDPEGFDPYGYNRNDVDRAGNHENDYLHNDAQFDTDENYNYAYDCTLGDWGFDGTKPVSTRPLTTEQKLKELLGTDRFPDSKDWVEADLVGRVQLLLTKYQYAVTQLELIDQPYLGD